MEETQYAVVYLRAEDTGDKPAIAMWNGQVYELKKGERLTVPLHLAEKFVRDNTPAPRPFEPADPSRCEYELIAGEVVREGGALRPLSIPHPVTGEPLTTQADIAALIASLKGGTAKPAKEPVNA